MKPTKILYENQEEVWEKAKDHLINLVDKSCVKKALVWGSLAEGEFGVYEEPYRGQEASDIDLVIVVDEDHPLPKEWKYLNERKSWFDLYRIGKFTHEGHTHKIDGLIVFPSRHDLKKMKADIEGRSKVIYVKAPK